MEDKRVLDEISIFLNDEDETESLARQFAPLLTKPDLTQKTPVSGGHIYLRGDLGAGKTCFVRAFLRACGVTGRIKSPSYALLESYKVSNLYFYHLDFYRFSDPREWIDAGFRDILQENAVVLIEWPEQAGGLLPPPDVDISLEYADHGRNARITAYSNKGQSWLSKITPPGPASSPKDSPAGDS
ncbi:MAG: tRNA (adenosine(37)-N6)-threonylcarbamoyltransferase complex ATPase subunit type 1 TsaE [Pusillimonas sp.]|jgi:tRNA threonylcarbamoyladenosine biosynthesis protein TsaE|nr:tRNA (adenosine(37)-N6)-threonylcarbamoyltransferase complex ATPase subunit type 1 TsaE [Pusillimonas sp.]|tara:strand:+ start:859 stop:1413 length:555 start_codon:yes stop_codon:yes gene_type:complete